MLEEQREGWLLGFLLLCEGRRRVQQAWIQSHGIFDDAYIYDALPHMHGLCKEFARPHAFNFWFENSSEHPGEVNFPIYGLHKHYKSLDCQCRWALGAPWLGVGIRFFGGVRFGFFGLAKIRFSAIKNRSVLQNLKNRHRS